MIFPKYVPDDTIGRFINSNETSRNSYFEKSWSKIVSGYLESKTVNFCIDQLHSTFPKYAQYWNNEASPYPSTIIIAICNLYIKVRKYQLLELGKKNNYG